MLGDEKLEESFGCDRCWPRSLDSAWGARRRLKLEEVLIDEMHYRVIILTCNVCRQHFISIFTETIDWADGEDPQYWIIMPLTRQEAADLAHRRNSISEEMLNVLASKRRSLRRDYPKEADKPSLSWATGVSVRQHD